MTEYKQWYEEKGSPNFFSQEQVSFSQCGPDKNMYLHELLRMTSDLAVEDFNQRGMDRSTLVKNNIAILVSRLSFRLHKMPVENEHITIQTWEEKNEPLLFIRAYEISDTATGEKLISGLSTWLLVDLKTRRLMPIKNFTMRQPADYVSEHDCLKPAKITPDSDMEFWEKRIIRMSDQDANGHTNNSRYAAFAIDALPKEFQSLKFSDIRINFSQEALLGQELSIWGKINENEKKATVLGKLDSTVSFECELYWA